MASLATWIYLNRNALPPRLISDWRRQLVTVFILNVFITFAVPVISKGGHFGGGLIGLIAAVPLDYLKLGTPAQRRIALVGLIAIPVICIGIVVRSFHFTGPVVRLADAHDDAVRLLREFSRRQELTDPKVAAAAIDSVRNELSNAIQTPVPRAPVWLPSQEERWKEIEPDANKLLRDLTLVRKSLPLRNQ
jgi:hypothetical protein